MLHVPDEAQVLCEVVPPTLQVPLPVQLFCVV
jgi:hypothetical protein